MSCLLRERKDHFLYGGGGGGVLENFELDCLQRL